MEDKMEAQIEVTVEARVKQILLSKGSVVPQNPTPSAFSPQFRGRSSYGSTLLDEEDASVPHPVDSITEPVNVRLYIRQEWTKDNVVVGQAWPVGDGTINGRPIPLGYARVTIDRILDKKYNKIPIEYTVAEDKPKLGQNKGSQVAWRKRFIKLDHQLSFDDEDDCESSPTHNDHSPSPIRDHSPPHLEPSPLRR